MDSKQNIVGKLPINVQLHDNNAHDLIQKMKLRALMRTAFYTDLGRKPPFDVSQMPSFVRAVRKKWGLLSNNSARRLLAQIEGFESWEDLQRHRG